jgi:DNA-directed RNA polymerase subunit RPC12/RpoP
MTTAEQLLEETSSMSDLPTLTCPNCGAALNAAGDETEIKCHYCGTTVVVPQSAPTPMPMMTQIVIPIETTGSIGTSGSSRAAWLVPVILVVVILGIVGFIITSVASQVTQVTNSALAPFSAALTEVPAIKTQLKATSTTAPTYTPEPTDTPEPTETPTPTPAPPPTYSKIVLRDDFSNPKSGWDRTKTSHGDSMNYTDNGYLISINSPDSGETSWIKDGLKDVSVEVDAETQSGTGWFGVMCRVRQDVGGYGFEISTDGDYAIYKFIFNPNGSTSKELISGFMDSDIFNAQGVNHVRGDCIGKTLTLVVNDRVIDKVSDGSFGTGGVGLLAVAYSDSDNGLDTLFTNYVVKAP